MYRVAANYEQTGRFIVEHPIFTALFLVGYFVIIAVVSKLYDRAMGL